MGPGMIYAAFQSWSMCNVSPTNVVRKQSVIHHNLSVGKIVAFVGSLLKLAFTPPSCKWRNAAGSVLIYGLLLPHPFSPLTAGDKCKKFALTWMAVNAATMAGDPKPCVMREKCVRCRWMVGSRICWGRVLHSGERSWFKRSISSLVITLQKKFE